MKVHAHFQQKSGGDPTEAWAKIRRGKPTASEFGRFVQMDGKLRKGEMPETYLADKLFERWTGRDKPGGTFLSVAVNNGVIIEEKAALFAEMEYGLKIQTVGFVSDDDERYGNSPDGLIGYGGLEESAPTFFSNTPTNSSGIEIKCPQLATHIKYLLAGELPADYLCQVQGSMFVTGSDTWHFLSYPLACYLDGFPPLHLVIERDEKFCANLSESLDTFLEKYDAAFNRLCEINGAPPKRIETQPRPESPAEDNFDLPI